MNITTPLTRKIVTKVWGYEDWIDNNPMYCGKKLFIAMGHHTSWHYHNIKIETMYVESGKLLLLYSNRDAILDGGLDKSQIRQEILLPHYAVKIHPGTRHRLEAIDGDCVVIEFSTEHRDEDSIRLIEGR